MVFTSINSFWGGKVNNQVFSTPKGVYQCEEDVFVILQSKPVLHSEAYVKTSARNSREINNLL